MDAGDIAEIFSPAIRVSTRRMFGGHGVYAEGVMFAIEAYGVLWLRCDAETLPAFEARGLRAFTYVKDGKPYAMSYRKLPDSAFDDEDELRRWVRLALEAARRVAAGEAAGSAARVSRPSARARRPASRSTR